VSGDAWQLTFKGVTTGAGAAGGTTLIDTNKDSGGANTYNGQYWVRITSGALKGKWKRIIDDDGSGTLTLENNGFEAQVGSGVYYEVYLSPEPVVVVDSSADNTHFVDATRTEPDVDNDPFWKDYYAVIISGTYRGVVRKITGFVPGTGTFTVASSMGGTLSAGDVVLLRRFIEADGISPGLTSEYTPRPMHRLNFSRGDGVVGAKGGTFAFNTQIRPGGLDTNETYKSETHGLYQAVGLEEVCTTQCTVGLASTTTSIVIGAEWENVVRPGVMVVINGEPRFVTAITDGGAADTLTISPPLTVAPAQNDTVNPTRNFFKTTDGDTYGVVLEWELDGIRHTMTGCKGNVTLASGALPMLQWSFNVDHWIREIEAAPYTAGSSYETNGAVIEADRQCWVDTTATNINGFTCTIGTETARRKVQGSAGINGGAGFQITRVVGGGTFRELYDTSGDSLPQDLKYSVRTSFGLIVVYGASGATFATRSPTTRIIQEPNPEDDEGVAMAPSVFESQDAGTAADGAGTLYKLPDFAFAIT